MKKAVFTFGRMNPPTIGHEKLVNKIKAVARSKSATPLVYLSHSQNAKKDPLTYDQKIYFAQRSFGNIVQKSPANTIIKVLQELESKGYTDIVLVVGSDRVSDFDTMINKYNGKDYTFNSIDVVSAGERDPDAEGVEGMSASKMRELVRSGTDTDHDLFHKGIPSKMSYGDGHRMYTQLRKSMKLESFEDIDLDQLIEEIDVDTVEIDVELDEVLTMQQRLKRARQMKRLAPKFKKLRQIKAKRMADPQRLMMRARKQALNIVRKRVAGLKGGHYNSLSTAEKIAIDKLVANKTPAIAKLAQKLLPKVRKAEIERLKKARGGSVQEAILPSGIADLMPGVEKFLDKVLNRKQYKSAVRFWMDLTKKNPSKSYDNINKAASVTGVNARQLHKHIEDMVSQGLIPKQLVNQYDVTEGNGQEDDVADVATTHYQTGYITSSRKKNLNAAFEKMCEQLETTDCLDEQFESYLNKQYTALYKKADKHGIDRSAVVEVYENALERYKHNPNTTQEQYGFASVNRFINDNKPQSLDESLRVERSAGIGTFMTAGDVGMRIQAGFAYHPSVMQEEDPCWDGYTQRGMKKKNGKEVPNCIPEEGGAGEEGTDKLANKYKKDTPYQMKEDVGSVQHHQFQPLLKHAMKHARIHKDIDVDGDVDALDDLLPDEVTAAEKDSKRIQKLMKMRGELEKKHTKKGVAFESVEEVDLIDQICEECDLYEDLIIEEAEYEGKKVKLNDPIRTNEVPTKKFKVYVKNDKGNVVVVRFGDPNLEIKRDDPNRRKNFRARHNCANPGPKWKARYWSCYQWRSGAKVDN